MLFVRLSAAAVWPTASVQTVAFGPSPVRVLQRFVGSFWRGRGRRSLATDVAAELVVLMVLVAVLLFSAVRAPGFANVGAGRALSLLVVLILSGAVAAVYRIVYRR